MLSLCLAAAAAIAGGPTAAAATGVIDPEAAVDWLHGEFADDEVDLLAAIDYDGVSAADDDDDAHWARLSELSDDEFDVLLAAEEDEDDGADEHEEDDDASAADGGENLAHDDDDDDDDDDDEEDEDEDEDEDEEDEDEDADEDKDADKHSTAGTVDEAESAADQAAIAESQELETDADADVEPNTDLPDEMADPTQMRDAMTEAFLELDHQDSTSPIADDDFSNAPDEVEDEDEDENENGDAIEDVHDDDGTEDDRDAEMDGARIPTDAADKDVADDVESFLALAPTTLSAKQKHWVEVKRRRLVRRLASLTSTLNNKMRTKATPTQVDNRRYTLRIRRLHHLLNALSLAFGDKSMVASKAIKTVADKRRALHGLSADEKREIRRARYIAGLQRRMGLDSKVKARMTSAIEREATIKVKKMIKWFINSFLDKNVVDMTAPFLKKPVAAEASHKKSSFNPEPGPSPNDPEPHNLDYERKPDSPRQRDGIDIPGLIRDVNTDPKLDADYTSKH